MRTLTVQLDESTEELNKVRKLLWTKESQIQELDNEMKSLLHDMDCRKRKFEEKEAQSLDIIRELRGQIMALKQSLEESNTSNSHLTQQIQIYLIEIEKLNQRLHSDKRFKQFVDIKRQVNTLKDKNEILSLKVLEHENTVAMPVMKKSGKVTTKRSRVMSAGTRPMSQCRLQRPKSSNVRTLVSMYNGHDSEEEEAEEVVGNHVVNSESIMLNL